MSRTKASTRRQTLKSNDEPTIDDQRAEVQRAADEDRRPDQLPVDRTDPKIGNASSSDPVFQKPVLTDHGRRVIRLEETPDGGHAYLDVEYFGDPDLYPGYLVKPVEGNPDVMDVNVNGDWARVAVERGPQTILDP